MATYPAFHAFHYDYDLDGCRDAWGILIEAYVSTDKDRPITAVGAFASKAEAEAVAAKLKQMETNCPGQVDWGHLDKLRAELYDLKQQITGADPMSVHAAVSSLLQSPK
jgi:hypothetical protein